MNFKAGDKVIWSHPDHDVELLTLKDMHFLGISGVVWLVEENEEYWYREKYMRLATPLDELL